MWLADSGKTRERLGKTRHVIFLPKKTPKKLSKFKKNLKSVSLSFCILAESMPSLAESVPSLAESAKFGRVCRVWSSLSRVLVEYSFPALTRQDSRVLASLQGVVLHWFYSFLILIDDYIMQVVISKNSLYKLSIPNEHKVMFEPSLLSFAN